MADRTPVSAKFLILGSVSPAFLRQTTESVAGRVEPVPISGFGRAEAGPAAYLRHWLRGGFPRSLLTEDDADRIVAVPLLDLTRGGIETLTGERSPRSEGRLAARGFGVR